MTSTRQAATVDRLDSDRSTAVDQYLSQWRQAMEESGHTYDSLAAFTRTGDRGYWHKLLHNEKPLRPENIVALPQEMQKKFEELRAKDLGLLVVKQMSPEDALVAALGGIASILAARPHTIAA